MDKKEFTPEYIRSIIDSHTLQMSDKHLPIRCSIEGEDLPDSDPKSLISNARYFKRRSEILANVPEELIIPVLKEKYNIKDKIEEEKEILDWSDLSEIDKFVIFQGAEKIYDIWIKGKKVRLEGKEILDYNIFRLRLFEEFGIMLPSKRGIGEIWSDLLSHWFKNYREVCLEKAEELSDSLEGKQLIIDYINNCAVANNYVIKEGVIILKDDFIYVPTKIIKKLLKRENLSLSMRKLAYVLDDYLASGSIPLKIENRSERFWKLKSNMFEIKKDNQLEISEDLKEVEE